MRKLCFLLAVFLVAGAAFAQENEKKELGFERINLEVNIGFPVHWTNGVHDDSGNVIEDKSVTVNTAIGIATTFNFTRTFGLILDTDFFVGAKLAGYASPTSDYISLSGANMFIGPVFYLYNSGALRIPFGVGVHLNYFADDLWVPQLGAAGAWLNRQEFQVGTGVSIGIQYHFDSGVYIFSRTNVAIDFLRMHSWSGSDGTDYNGTLHTDLAPDWIVKPTLGIGIKF